MSQSGLPRAARSRQQMVLAISNIVDVTGGEQFKNINQSKSQQKPKQRKKRSNKGKRK